MRKIIAVIAFAACICGTGISADSLVPNRMAISEIGEWVSFALPDGYVQKHIVVKRDGEGPEAQVTIRVDNIYDGEVVDSKYINEEAGLPMTELPQPDKEGVTVSSRNASFTLKGKEYDGVAIDVTRDGNPYQTWFVSSEIPVYGLAKRTSTDGGSDFEIADFGAE